MRILAIWRVSLLFLPSLIALTLTVSADTLDELNTRRAEVQARFEEVDGKLADLKAEQEGLRADTVIEYSGLTAVEQKILKEDKDISILLERIEALKAEIETLKKEIRTKVEEKPEAATLREEVTSKLRRRDEITAERRELIGQRTKLWKELKALDAEIRIEKRKVAGQDADRESADEE